MTKILFIRADISDSKKSAAMQPLVFGILDALTPPRFDRVFMDDCIGEVDFSICGDIVAISFGTYAAKRAYSIADKFRQKGSTIVMGGFHASAVPDEALQHADAVVVGDAEPVWQLLLTDYENGSLRPQYVARHGSSELITTANRHMFKGKRYFPCNPVQWGRGCKHNCDFCSIKSFYGTRQLLRPIGDVVAEIKQLDNKVIFFVDDNLYHSNELFDHFLDAMEPLNKKWACQISIDVAWDTGLLKRMKASGCTMALIGIETFDAQNLAQMNKQWNRSKADYANAIARFRQQGIMVYGTFVFGYDNDSRTSFNPAVDFAIDQKLFLANFNPLYPMPGTPLYQRLQAEERLTFKEWWLDPDFYYGKTMFEPANMSPRDLETGCYGCKKRFNGVKSIFYRLFDFRANSASFKNMGLYLLVNLANRRGIYQKQNLKLGNPS